MACIALGSISSTGQQKKLTSQEVSQNIHRREQWFAKGRESPVHSAGVLRQRALRQKTAAREFRRKAARPNAPDNIFAGNWVSLGPTPIVSNASTSQAQDYNVVAGRATAVAIDPADTTGNTVYVGRAYGGVWKSINAGPLSSNPSSVAWVPLTDDQATLAVGSIAIQPQPGSPDPAKSVILVGTGETNGSLDSYYGLGILRSADAGSTWTLIQNDGNSHPFAGLGFGQIAFSTDQPTEVVAAASTTAQGLIDGMENPAIALPGLYFSGDSGISWNHAVVNDGSAVTDPSSATSVIYNDRAAKFFGAISLHGIYSSVDGSSWVRLSNQPGALGSTCPAHNSSTNCPLYRGELAAVPGRNEMYVWYVDANDNDGGIWQSLDAGTTWTQLDDSGITNCGDLFGGCGTEQGFYNLALAAVPDGMATDLYAGAVNLYKCTISAISLTCGSQGPFINLTHVYGCSSIARVHPAQHAIASLLINNNTQDVMFFANDGGIYRLSDAYGQLSGSCGTTNFFDSLNATLGSMTQLVSFSQSTKLQGPNPDVLLAGAQGNGSPGTESVESSTTWQNVNAGDGGFTAISPNDDKLWLVSNPPDSVSGVNIFKCDLGAGCHTTDFQNNQAVSGTEVGGDAGAFNTPFLLDPQGPSQIIVGTCRVWEGPISGGGLTALSYNFETGGDGICSGNETNVVRALAAGGSANGLSKVIYAGTEGTGPLATSVPTGGHIWVSTDTSSGPKGWSDQTASINPQHYSISSIAVDDTDISGLTAYVSIMGFNVTHIWKTTSGGTSWTNFDTNIPNAPVNALIVDSTRHVIFAGTDLGVFVSGTANADWSEVGPNPTSNNPGYLPNVAVTNLQIFNPNGNWKLRASTYGRGMWELSRLNLGRPVPASLTMGAPATSSPVSLQLTSASFYGVVNLSCTLPQWAQCNFYRLRSRLILKTRLQCN